MPIKKLALLCLLPATTLWFSAVLAQEYVTREEYEDGLAKIDIMPYTTQDSVNAAINSGPFLNIMMGIKDQVTAARISLAKGEGTLTALAEVVKEDHFRTGENVLAINDLDKRATILEDKYSSTVKIIVSIVVFIIGALIKGGINWMSTRRGQKALEKLANEQDKKGNKTK